MPGTSEERAADPRGNGQDFCPVLAGGRLYAAIPPGIPKGHDLRRDPRCAIHALPGPQDDEVSIRARAKQAGPDPPPGHR